MIETWKPVPGYEGRYEASDQGRVRSLPRTIFVNATKRNPSERFVSERILKPMKSPNGYMQVALCKCGKTKRMSLHRVIATTFYPHGGEVVNHKNGYKTDNRACNLEWCSQKENIRHSIDTGLKRIEGRRVVRSDGALYESVNAAARAIHAPHANVQAVLSGKRKKVHGYSFEYVE